MIKALISRCLSVVPHPSQWLQNGNTLTVLTYHRVLPDDHPDRNCEQPGMIASPDTLEKNVQWLQKKGYEFISIEDWPRLKDEKPTKRYAAITFDDGWYDNYEFARPVLAQNHVPFTIYLVAHHLGSGQGYWPTDTGIFAAHLPEETFEQLVNSDDLIAFQKQHTLPNTTDIRTLTQSQNESLNRFIERNKAHSDQELSETLTHLYHKFGLSSDVRSKTIGTREFKKLKQSGGRAGSHTCNHTRLRPGLDPAILVREVETSKQILTNLTNTPVTSFCYPNGDYSDSALNLVSNHYDTAVTTGRGVNTGKTPMFKLKRFNMHDGISADRHRFFSRIRGWV